jgi:hypothetical protein
MLFRAVISGGPSFSASLGHFSALSLLRLSRHRPRQALLYRFAILLVSLCSLFSHHTSADLTPPIVMAPVSDDTLTKVSTEGKSKGNLEGILSHRRS